MIRHRGCLSLAGVDKPYSKTFLQTYILEELLCTYSWWDLFLQLYWLKVVAAPRYRLSLQHGCCWVNAVRGACRSDTAAHAPPCQQWFGGQPSEKLTFCYRLHPMISDLCFPDMILLNFSLVKAKLAVNCARPVPKRNHFIITVVFKNIGHTESFFQGRTKTWGMTMLLTFALRLGFCRKLRIPPHAPPQKLNWNLLFGEAMFKLHQKIKGRSAAHYSYLL